MEQPIDTLKFWAEGSGLLPIRLSPNVINEQYILLDGGKYDFCIDLKGDTDNPYTYYSSAWSSDVKNFIAIDGSNAIVYNWCKKQKEKVKLDLIKEKFSTFLNILNSNSYKTSEDITPFILGLFSQIRNLTMGKKEPLEALNLLFKLLVSIEEDNFTNDVCKIWGIENVNEPRGFDELKTSIKEGIRHITPNLDFILRHAAGPLFESAHREALYFDPNFNLFGEMSSHIGLASYSKYSSIHYTPRFLVRSIVENSLCNVDLQAETLNILDPACGSGAFLQEVLKQLKEKGYNGKITIKGFDISSLATQTCNFLLQYENRAQWGNKLILDIRCGNSLEMDWGLNDLILMNPPFISYELIKDKNLKDLINDLLLELKMKKRPNMAAAFLYKAVASLGPKGTIGAIIPSSILHLDQYKTLRNLFHEDFCLSVIAQLGNFVFSDALTDTSFIIAKKINKFNFRPLNIWCANIEDSAFEAMRGWRKMKYDNTLICEKEAYNIYYPSNFPVIQDSWKIIPHKDEEFLKSIKAKVQKGSLKSISEIFDIKQGIIRGNKDFFVLSEQEYDNFSKNEKFLFRPLASSETIDNGTVDKKLYLWYPYNSYEIIIKSEEQLQKYPNIYNWLMPYKNVLSNREGINNWWELTRPRITLFNKEENILCSKRNGDSHSFAIIPPQFVVEEGNVFLFKNNKYCEEDKYFYLSLFSSKLFHRLLSMFAKPLRAGFDLGKAQIKNIPIIDVNESGLRESELYYKIVELGKEYSKGTIWNLEVFDKYISFFF